MMTSAASRPRVVCKSTGFSSARFGVCEVCHAHVADTWIATDGERGSDYVFGHESCVKRSIGWKGEGK